MYNLAEKVIDKYKSLKKKAKEALNEHLIEKIKDFLASDFDLLGTDGEDFIVGDVDDKRPPKEWWDACYAEIKKKNPDYTDEQIRKTCGDIYYHKGVRKVMGKSKDFYTEDFVNYLGKFFVKNMEDFTTMEGFLSRSGQFEYPDPKYPNDPSKTIIKIKKWDEPGGVKPAFQEIKLLPMYGSRWNDSHTERDDRLIGFMHDWRFIEPGVVDENGHVLAKQEYFDDIRNLSDLRDPTDLPMSLAFDDATPESEYQYISQLHHGAVSLNKLERDRCSTAGGMPCNSKKIKSTTNQAHDSVSELPGSDGTETKPILKIKKNEEKTMTEDFEEIDDGELTEDTDATNTWGKKLEDCIASGKSKEECQIAIRRQEKAGKETNAKGGKIKADFEAIQKENEELKKKIADMEKAQNNEIKDLVDYVDKLKAKEAKEKEAEMKDMREALTEKLGVKECDFINSLDYKGLKNLMKFEELRPKPKSEKDMEINSSDMSLADFDKRVDELKKNLGWMVIK